MPTFTDPSIEDREEESLIKMALHLTKWATEMTVHVGNNFSQEFQPEHAASRLRLQRELENIQIQFQRGLYLLQSSGCSNTPFGEWLNNANEFSRVLSKLIKRCRLVEISNFLQFAQAITNSAVHNLNQMQLQLNRLRDSKEQSIYAEFEWQLPGWYTEEVLNSNR